MLGNFLKDHTLASWQMQIWTVLSLDEIVLREVSRMDKQQGPTV